MKSDPLGPAHPCLGCRHRGGIYVATHPQTRRPAPASQCLTSGIYTPIFMDSQAPKWCPGKEAR